jgi:hypothetical protein
VTKQTTDKETVQEARKLLAYARTMLRKRRLRRYQGRNRGGEQAEAIEASAVALLDALIDQPGGRKSGSWQRRIAGLVYDEHALGKRLSQARDDGQERPELASRMNLLRRELREWLGA